MAVLMAVIEAKGGVTVGTMTNGGPDAMMTGTMHPVAITIAGDPSRQATSDTTDPGRDGRTTTGEIAVARQVHGSA